ncbi:MAG TPA: asparaginase [Patescibacteria group bacterium]|nr:asparaginase [Patescibacteria group bacterium]
MTAPVTIEIWRGPAVESRHAVHAVLMDGAGKIKQVYGDANRPTFPRSALKPLQAIALVETGASAAHNLSNAELALACASHSGEQSHVLTVSGWLTRLGLDENALECGAHSPYASTCSPATILSNNCSGKHTGMLTLCRHMQVPHQGYIDVNHPAQHKILQTVAEICGVAVTPATCGVDGCSAPNPVMPLSALAAGFAKFMNPRSLSIQRGTACRHLYQAMVEHPELVGGTKRMDTILMQAARRKIMCKVGGEGVYGVVVPEKDTVIALKAEDGNIRAVEAALYAVLERHDLADSATLDAARPHALNVLKNWNGREVGQIRIGK